MCSQERYDSPNQHKRRRGGGGGGRERKEVGEKGREEGESEKVC